MSWAGAPSHIGLVRQVILGLRAETQRCLSSRWVSASTNLNGLGVTGCDVGL